MPDPLRLQRCKFRAWHRGTREADYIIGCFFDRHHRAWGEDEVAWFEALLNEEDPDVLDWVLGARPAPARLSGPLLAAMCKLDYVEVSR